MSSELSNNSIEEIREMTAILAQQLAEDIQAARTREDHVRTTTRANQALILLRTVEGLTGQ